MPPSLLFQKHKVVVPPKAPVKEEKKAQNTWKQPRRKQQVSFSDQVTQPFPLFPRPTPTPAQEPHTEEGAPSAPAQRLAAF